MNRIGRIFYILLVVLMASSLKPAMASEYAVKMLSDAETGEFRFEPETLNIEPGDTVVWINAQDDGHDVMAEAVPKGAESWQSPLLTEEGQSWSYTFSMPGTYRYHCHPHGGLGMRGLVLVGDVSTAEQTSPVEGHDHTEVNDSSAVHHHEH